MPNEAVTIYVTKDAIARGGIRRAQAWLPDGAAAGMAIEVTTDGQMDQSRCVLNGGDWRASFDEAARAVEYVRSAQLASLERQIAAIRAIDLTKPVEG